MGCKRAVSLGFEKHIAQHVSQPSVPSTWPVLKVLCKRKVNTTHLHDLTSLITIVAGEQWITPATP